MNLLKTLTKKNLLLNKKRTIVTIIGIMLSVALITAVASIYASGIESLKYFEKKTSGNFHIVYYDVEKDGVYQIQQNRMVEKISYTKSLGYAKIESKNIYKPYAHVLAFDSTALSNLSIRLQSGRLPKNENEIVIPTHLKTNGRLELNIGDEIDLEIGNRYNGKDKLNDYDPYIENEVINNSFTKKYKIVGIIERPANNIETFDNPGYSFITYLNNNDAYENVNMYVRYTKTGLKNNYKVTSDILGIKEETIRILYGNIRNSDEEKENEAEKDYQNSKYYFNMNMYLIELEKNPLNNSTLGDLSIVVGVVCLIIVFTSTFCIKNSFDISITEKIKQYGMLRSIGATKKQIRKPVFYEATILGIIGIPLGIILGFLASFILIIISNSVLNGMTENNLKLQFEFSMVAVVVAIILGIITIYLSAIRSAIKAAKVSPLESIRNSGNIKIKKLTSPKLINKVFGIGGEISYKNLKRNKKKYRTTTLSLVVSVITFVSLSYFMSLLIDSINEEIKLTDYNISLSCLGNKDCESKMLKILTFDNIDKYTIFKTEKIELKNFKVNKEVEKMEPASYTYYDEELKKEVTHSEYENIDIVSLGNLEYRKYLKELNIKYEDAYKKGILIDTFILNNYSKGEKAKYKIYNYDAKDIVKYSYYKKEGDMIEKSIELIKTTDKVPFGLKDRINNQPSLSTMLVVSDEYYNELFSDSSIQNIYFKSSNANKLQDDIDEYLENYEYDLRNIDESRKQIQSLINLIGIFLYGFIIVIILIGITNIFNTITTSIYLRKREFAMLKSVGMTNTEFDKMIRLESIFMGLKSLIYSLPIGLILTYIIYINLGKKFGILYHIPFKSIIISICTVFLLIMLIMRYSVNKVNKQNIIETIRNENI